MSISPPPPHWVELEGLNDWYGWNIILYYLGLNADKNTDNKRKGSNKNCSEFNLLQKT